MRWALKFTQGWHRSTIRTCCNGFLRYETSEIVAAKIQVIELTKVSQVGWYTTLRIVVAEVQHLDLLKAMEPDRPWPPSCSAMTRPGCSCGHCPTDRTGWWRSTSLGLRAGRRWWPSWNRAAGACHRCCRGLPRRSRGCDRFPWRTAAAAAVLHPLYLWHFK